MNGAQSLVRTLVASGVDVCFANPGTSEMHFVAALDQIAGMRCVLGLFEGVVTGAADGYYRLSNKPAATLLHLGPGLGNGLANLHNARKAGSGVVNIVGEHASHHLKHDAPLTADIEGIARPMSHWVHTARSSATVAGDGAAAVTQARTAPGRVATLILPADTAWGPATGTARAAEPAPRRAVADDAVEHAAAALQRGRAAGGAGAPAHKAPAALLLGGIAAREPALTLAGRIAARTGCEIWIENNVPRLERGAGRVRTQRVPYVVDDALARLQHLLEIVLVGAKAPVAFFGYPGKPSLLIPEACAVTRLAAVDEDIVGALEALAERLGARGTAPAHVAELARPGAAALPTGRITPQGIATVLGALLPEGAVVVDESISVGRNFGPATAHAPPHDWLNIVGGSIGFGLPAATGAALAAPGRPVIVLEGDGSAMYTLQALWTMAREGLNVKVLVLANRSYQILRGEFAHVGAGTPGQRASDMLDLDRPALDWVALARGMGVDAARVETQEALAAAFGRALASPGPVVIEAVIDR